MSFGFGFALPAYQLRGGGGNNPFNQLGPTLDLSFVDGATNVGDQLGPDTYTLNTDFITPEYQVAAQYAVWENGVGLAQKTFSQIVTFTRASTVTYFNSAGTLTTAAVNEARFDYNPSTLAPLGFLIEEQRTNSIRNNTMQGAVAGTPGTLPTNWSVDLSAVSGISREVVGTGTENGITYIDIRLFGTSAVTANALILLDVNNAAAASPSQAWSISSYAKIQAGSLTGIASTFLEIFEYSSVPAYLRQTSAGTFTPTTAGLSTQRVSGTVTTGASTAFTRGSVTVRFTGGVAADITLRIGLPQLEQGAFATSVIPTTTTALTRSADVASVNTLSPWFNSTAGTIYAEAQIAAGIGAAPAVMAGLDDTTINNRIQLRRQSPGTVGDGRFVSSGGNWTGTVTSGTLTGVNKQAVAYAVSDQAGAVNGTLMSGIVSVATLPTITRLALGDGQGSTPLNGYLRRITYYPRRLSNAELQAITV